MPDKPDESRLESICRLLRRHGVSYLVIGGQAEYLMGSARVTFDVDICYGRSQENLERLAEALSELRVTLRGAPEDVPVILDARALALGNNYTFDSPLGPVDFLGYVEPVGDYESMIQSAETYTIADMDVKTISLDNLIRIKEHLQRPKDRDSLTHLRAIKQVRQEQQPPTDEE